MIRGKAFEYTVMTNLQRVLPSNEWNVTKASLVEETAFHDTDIRVFHKRTGKAVRVECKLAKKEGYRLRANGDSEVLVKCMRSRTLGAAKVNEIAPKLGVTVESLSVHNDQYVPADFDVVVTPIGNSFYRTDRRSGAYEWRPTKSETEFLVGLGGPRGEGLKDFAFHKIYLARTRHLAARPDTGVVCSRKDCSSKDNCGFIPNYPVIHFSSSGNNPTAPWTPIEQSATLPRLFIA